MTFFLVPFEVSDACTAALLERYGLLKRRDVILPELIQFAISHAEWGACGMIQLKKVSETGCEMIYFSPPVVLDIDAMTFLSRVEEKMWKTQELRSAEKGSAEGNPGEGDSTQAPREKLNIWDIYPDFPDFGEDLPRIFNFSEEMERVWGWLLVLTQGYLSQKRAWLLDRVTQQHMKELAQRQQPLPAEAAQASMGQGPAAQASMGQAPVGQGPAAQATTVRPGPKPTDPQVRERILAEWEKAKGRINQEAFCRSQGIGVSTLHSWMRRGRENGNEL